MRKQCVVMAAVASAYILGRATAAQLTGAEIKDLISGNTMYLEWTSTTGTPHQGVMYYDPNGSVLYKTPGVMWHGTWKIEGDTACTDWKELSNRSDPCTKYDKQGDTITPISAATGVARAKVTKIVPGNAENLTP
jgi:hypothetical protein